MKSHFKIFGFFLYYFSLYVMITSYQQEKLDFVYQIETIDGINIEEGVQYNVSYTKPPKEDNFAYIKVTVNPNDKDNKTGLMDSEVIYFSDKSFDRNDTNLLNYEYEKEIVLYIPRSLLIPTGGNFYLTVRCMKSPCTYSMILETREQMDLPRDSFYKFYTNANNIHNEVKISRESEVDDQNKDENATMTIWLSGPNDVNFTLFYKSEDKEIPIKVDNFSDGMISTFLEKDYPYEENAYYIMKINTSPGSMVAIGSKTIKSSFSKTNQIIPNQREILGYLLKGILEEECYNISYINNAEIETSDVNLNIQVFSRYATLIVKEEDGSINDTHTISRQYLVTISSEEYISKLFCIGLSSENDFKPVNYQIQVTDISNKGSYTDIFTPQLDGYIYTRFLKEGEIAFFTGDLYSFQLEANFNMKKIIGNPKMYLVKCNDFPFCYFNRTYLESLDAIAPKSINDFFVYSLPPSEIQTFISSSVYVLVVLCDEDEYGDECLFETSIFTDNSPVHIREDDRFFQTINKGEKDVYLIDFSGEKNFLKVFVNVLTFSGDISTSCISSSSDITIHSYISGNKEYYTIIPNANNTVTHSYLEIKGERDSTYIVDYKVIRDLNDSITMNDQTGFNYLQTISPSVGSKIFRFANQRIDEKSNVILDFYPLNCKISVKNKNNTKIKSIDYLTQDIIKRDDDIEYYDSGIYEYKVEVEKMENVTRFENDFCMVYASSVEYSSDNNKNGRHIVVPENIQQKIILSKEFNNVRFVYPHMAKEGFVLLNFLLKEEVNFHVKIYANDNELLNLNIGKSRSVYLSEDSLRAEKYCPLMKIHDVCVIKVDITLDVNDENKELNLEFTARSKESSPTYLKKTMLREDVITGGQGMHYFTEVGAGEEGNILINPKRGSVIAYARIVSKTEKEENPNWKGKYLLPDKDHSSLFYNSYTQEILFTAEDTKNCNKGCYLLLNIVNFLDSEKFIKDSINYPFTLMIQTTNGKKSKIDINKLAVISIPFNEFIASNVEPYNQRNNYDFFSLTIPYDTDEILIDFLSVSCYMIINIGEVKPTEYKNDFSFISPGFSQVFRISSNDIKAKYKIKTGEELTSLKNLKFTICVSTEYVDSAFTSPFNFRFRAPKKNYKNFIFLNNDQEALCGIKGPKGNCYFLATYDKIEDINNFIFYPSCEEDNDVQMITYANLVNKNKFDNWDKSYMESSIPTEKNSKWSNKNNNTDYLYIPNSLINPDEKETTYILLNVEVSAPLKKSDDNTIISLKHGMYSYEGKMISNPNTKTLFTIKNDPIYLNFYVSNNYNLIIHIEDIDNSGYVFWDTEDKKEGFSKRFELRNSKDRIALTTGYNNKYPLKIMSTTPIPEKLKNVHPGFSFFVYYDIQPSEMNFNSLQYGNSAEMSFKDTDFPFIFYAKLPNIKYETTLTIRFYNLNIKSDSNNLSEGLSNKVIDISKENFQINGLVTSEEIINKKKSDKKVNPPDTYKFFGTYDKLRGVALIQFTPEKMKVYNISGINYLYMTIFKAVENIREYSGVSLEASVVPSNDDGSFVPEKLYNYGKLQKGFIGYKNYKRYALRHSGNKNFMKIEFAANSDLINYSIIPITKETEQSTCDYFKNSTAFISENTNGGKGTVYLKLDSNILYVYLTVFYNEKDKELVEDGLTNFIFRYSLAESIDSLPRLDIETYDLETIYNDKNNLEIIIPEIKGFKESSKITFYIKVIKSYDSLRKNYINTLALTNDNPVLIFKYKNEDYKDGKQTIRISGLSSSALYYLIVQADFEFNNYDEELISFNSVYDPSEYESSNNTINKVILWICVGMILLIIIIICIFIFCFKKMKNTNADLMKKINTISFADSKKEKNDQENLLLGENANNI